MYEFSQDSTHLGAYDYNKTSRGALNAAVEDESAYRAFSATTNTNAWYDLGDMAGANSTLDIFANGHSINGAGYSGVNVASGQTLNIDGANSWNGFVSTSNGGAINNAGTLNVTGSTITNNSAVNGGAIYNTGTATLVNTSLTNNNATTQGGAIYNTGTVNIIADGSNVSVSGNTTGTSTKTSNAIYLESGSHLNLNAGSSNSITIGDKITTNSTTPAEININKTGIKETASLDAPTNGTVNINNNVSGNINLYGGTLSLGADNYLNNDNLNCYGGNINMINNSVGTMALGTLNLGSATTNLAIDADLANSKIDTITANSVSATTGKLNINNIHMISDAANKTTAIQLADATMRNYITMNANDVSGPIYKYDVAYDAASGSASFVSNKQAFSPTVMATPVSSATGTFLNQLNVYSETLGRTEVYMSIPQNDRLLMRYINRTASTEESPKVFSPLYTPEERGGAWFKQYTTFESIPLNNGPDVSNVGYGAILGVDSPMHHLKHGYDGYVTAFAGYNGSHQNYDNIGVYQNGGNLGLTGVVYKGNFFAALSGTVGASNGNSNTPYGVDNFTTLIAGLAGKVGYNIEINSGRFILQPTYSMSYTFANTFDYTTAAGTHVTSDPLNAIQISPGLKFIANLKDGWQPYLSIDMVWNLMDSQKFYANNVQLPGVSVAPYFEYGLGVQRRWGERFSGYAQTMFRGGGRNGITLQFGFRWAFGK
jgi:outer membrane autotransporter protein